MAHPNHSSRLAIKLSYKYLALASDLLSPRVELGEMHIPAEPSADYDQYFSRRHRLDNGSCPGGSADPVAAH